MSLSVLTKTSLIYWLVCGDVERWGGGLRRKGLTCLDFKWDLETVETLETMQPDNSLTGNNKTLGWVRTADSLHSLPVETNSNFWQQVWQQCFVLTFLSGVHLGWIKHF